MIENDYLLAWGAYAIAALGCLLVWLRLTRWMWRYLREPLRLLVAILLFCPTIVDPARELFAPALAIVALDLIFHVGNNAWRAVADLAMYGLIAFALYLLFVAIRWPLERASRARKAAREEGDADSELTLRERLHDDRDTRQEPRRSPGLRVEPRL
ncbi:MFS transporter [Phytopseudomonas dryadis]|uniref:MFS transporter n=1 Tax=Phytopseudomonas dryadis TaxID=2487520 RepID=A0A4Q9R3Q4_9GAMM|nr:MULTISPECIES: MFS transporter [Pseudomonas]TBU93407.1 MFS transporter [Pseudomonas dryadis]TBV07085.1 MFS transporter [Pseudomonas dryadis]TBV19522.1 MFS transporter [Pseudomonas sp. FRB 230]